MPSGGSEFVHELVDWAVPALTLAAIFGVQCAIEHSSDTKPQSSTPPEPLLPPANQPQPEQKG